MSDVKSAKTLATAPFVRFSRAEALRNKLARDARRKSIRSQNARSKAK